MPSKVAIVFGILGTALAWEVGRQMIQFSYQKDSMSDSKFQQNLSDPDEEIS